MMRRAANRLSKLNDAVVTKVKRYGEPYAGKLHVRFDEGAGVPDNKGRPALLYLLYLGTDHRLWRSGGQQAYNSKENEKRVGRVASRAFACTQDMTQGLE